MIIIGNNIIQINQPRQHHSSASLILDSSRVDQFINRQVCVSVFCLYVRVCASVYMCVKFFKFKQNSIAAHVLLLSLSSPAWNPIGGELTSIFS